MNSSGSLLEILNLLKGILPGELVHEAEPLVCSAWKTETGRSLARIDIYSRVVDFFSSELEARVRERALAMAQERLLGKPLQYITGSQFFLDHEYEVSPHVLIPRPETEGLVIEAIERLMLEPEMPRRGIEVGLGSGVISIELLARFPSLEMWASEYSKEAMQLGLKNAGRILVELNPHRLKAVPVEQPEQVLEPFHSLGSAVDLIISNPPYLVSEDSMGSGVIQFEPHRALFAPVGDPVFFYRRVADQAPLYLRDGGWVFMEVPHERSKKILALFASEDRWNAKVLPDLTGRDRVLVAQLKGKN